ncbi:MAG: hypothetical protein NZ530_01945 [Thermodesulfobacteriaceae bacterium]|nr:hypothetical protein [Thermodesulfobacteriaceae bacterium]
MVKLKIKKSIPEAPLHVFFYYLSKYYSRYKKCLKYSTLLKKPLPKRKFSLRLKVIEFHNKYGTQATKEAYGVSKSTVYRCGYPDREHQRGRLKRSGEQK